MIGFTVGLLIGAFSGFCTACLMTTISGKRSEKGAENAHNTRNE